MVTTEEKIRAGLELYGNMRVSSRSTDTSFIQAVQSGARRRARARRVRSGVASVTAAFLLLLVVHLSGPTGQSVQLHGVYLADAYDELTGYGSDSLVTFFSDLSMNSGEENNITGYMDLFQGEAVYSPVDQLADADDAILEQVLQELAAFDLFEQSLAGASAGRES